MQQQCLFPFPFPFFKNLLSIWRVIREAKQGGYLTPIDFRLNVLLIGTLDVMPLGMIDSTINGVKCWLVLYFLGLEGQCFLISSFSRWTCEIFLEQ